MRHYATSAKRKLLLPMRIERMRLIWLALLLSMQLGTTPARAVVFQEVVREGEEVPGSGFLELNLSGEIDPRLNGTFAGFEAPQIRLGRVSWESRIFFQKVCQLDRFQACTEFAECSDQGLGGCDFTRVRNRQSLWARRLEPGLSLQQVVISGACTSGSFAVDQCMEKFTDSIVEFVVDELGFVIFEAGATGASGLWLAEFPVEGEPIPSIARSSQPAPGTNSAYGPFGVEPFAVKFPLSRSGRAAFSAGLLGSTDIGVWEFNTLEFTGSESVTPVLVPGQTVSVPDGAGGDELATVTTVIRLGAINVLGRVAVLAGLDNGKQGIWLSVPPTMPPQPPPELVALQGEAAPGIPGAVYNFFNAGHFGPSLNDSIELAFSAVVMGPNLNSFNNSAIWVGEPGEIELFVRGSDPAPGTNTQFRGFSQSDPLINRDGEVAFLAQIPGSGFTGSADGVWVGTPGAEDLELVVHEGQEVTAEGLDPGVTVFEVRDFAFNRLGQVVVLTQLVGPGIDLSNDVSLWSFAEGELSLLAREGTSASFALRDGSEITDTVVGIQFKGGSGGEDGRPSGLDVDGILAVAIATAGGNDGIYTVSLGGGASAADVENKAGSTGDPISTLTGELFSEEPADLDLGGPLAVGFARYYASGLEALGRSGRLGTNWRHSYEWQLTVAGDEATAITDRGRLLTFERQGEEWAITGAADVPFQLVEVESSFHLGDPRTDLLYVFDASGRLVSIEDGKGNGLTLSYAGTDLAQVDDGLGRTVLFQYAVPGGLLQRVSDGTRAVVFGHTDRNLTSVTNPLNQSTQYTYDASNLAAGRLTGVTRPRGNTIVSQIYDLEGRVSSQMDEDGDPLTLAYQGADTALTDALGHIRTHVHDPSGQLVSFVDEAGEVVAFEYDAAGRRHLVRDRKGNETTRTYHDPSGKVATETDATNATTAFQYEPRVFRGVTFYDLAMLTLPDGAAITSGRDLAGNVTSITGPLGNISTFSYNTRGQTLTATNPLGGTTTFTYNADGTLATRVDAAGNQTTFEYDALRRLTQIVRADDSSVSLGLDALDRVRTVTDELGNTATLDYDDNGNVSTLTDRTAESTTLVYDGQDRLEGVTDPLGHSAAASYDALGRLAALVDRNGGETQLGYDARRRLTEVTDPEGAISSFEYDVDHLLTAETNPLLETNQLQYDSAGRLVGTTSPLGRQVGRLLDAMGRIRELTDEIGGVTTLEYDLRGLPTSMSLPGGDVAAHYSRNALGLVSTATDPNGHDWLQAYDGQGRLTSTTDPLGNEQSLEYDVRNRVHLVTFPGGDVNFEYDGVGNLQRALFSDATDIGVSYDAESRLVFADGASLEYDANGAIVDSNGLGVERDPGGRIASLAVAPGRSLTYQYDRRNQVTQVRDWLGGELGFVYDAAGKLVRLQRPNGVVTTLEYDADGRLVGIEDGADGAASPLATSMLTRDPRGHVTSATRSVPLAAGVESEVRALGYDAASQVVGFEHDGLGRVVEDDRRTYVWDLASRLLSYTEGSTQVSFGYDGLGRRVSRSTDGVTRTYVWNEAFMIPAIVVEREGGEDVRYYVHTPQGHLLYSIDASDGSRQFYHYDEMGNTLFLTDDAGSVIATYAYTPYGEMLAQTGVVENLFTWQGQAGVQREGSTGLHYVRARYYDARTGRFLSRDPVRSLEPRALNPYGYALANPRRFVDPSGLDPPPPNDGYLVPVGLPRPPPATKKILSPIDALERIVAPRIVRRGVEEVLEALRVASAFRDVELPPLVANRRFRGARDDFDMSQSLELRFFFSESGSIVLQFGRVDLPDTRSGGAGLLLHVFEFFFGIDEEKGMVRIRPGARSEEPPPPPSILDSTKCKLVLC